MTLLIKLSIITVNLNNAAGLSKTIESVASQIFTNYEHIIIDGGSTDGSVDIIKDYEQKYNGVPGHLYWVSEPDKGIYNAMNKGIKVARGEYCLFLNSGDTLLNKSVLEDTFKTNPKEEIVYCNLKLSHQIVTFPEKLTYLNFFNGSLGHPSTFIKKELFYRVGFYNEENKVVSDWEFFLKAIIRHHCSYKHINITLSFFDSNGISSCSSFDSIKTQERKKVLHSIYPELYEDYSYLVQIIRELEIYRNSKIIQTIKVTQQSKLYKKIRNLFNKTPNANKSF